LTSDAAKEEDLKQSDECVHAMLSEDEEHSVPPLAKDLITYALN